MSPCKEPAISSDLTDQLLADGDAVTALQQGSLLDWLKNAFAERAFGGTGSSCPTRSHTRSLHQGRCPQPPEH